MDKVDAIVLAAGRGTRMGEEIPKQLLRLGGKPLLIHVLEVFEQIDRIDRVLVTYLAGYEDRYAELFKQYRLDKPVLVAGGETRQWSVERALTNVRTERVLIHESVRPFIDKSFVTSLLADNSPAVVPTIPITFTVAVGGDEMTAELNRSELHNVQLPQVFNTDLLRKAHTDHRSSGGATEDSLLVFRNKGLVRFTAGREQNIKITTPLDLRLAELIYDEL